MRDIIRFAFGVVVALSILGSVSACAGPVGPQGPQGPPGPQGPIGSPGPKGSFDPSKIVKHFCPPEGGGDGNTYSWCMCSDNEVVLTYYVECLPGDALGSVTLTGTNNVKGVCTHLSYETFDFLLPNGKHVAVKSISMGDITPKSITLVCAKP